MRTALFVALVALGGGAFVVACGSSSALRDDFAEASPEDFRSFRYEWTGTGAFGNFAIDDGCAYRASGSLHVYGVGPESAGVANASDCDELKRTVVSPAVIDAMRAPNDAGECSDDYPSATLELKTGATITAHRQKCTSDEPYRTLIPLMKRIRGSSAVDASVE